ncbi:pirin family protein [Simkania sp.]|uniref:pirin family protein n=1 Tax=Simkania sp. TaxID=34094 RepID=UPI003B5263BA
MKLEIRKAQSRGVTEIDWLISQHTFSFGNYQDPNYMGFESLRVINEDSVAPRGGFPKHPHKNMEIVSYVLEGALEHEDSMGNGSIIYPGEIQLMSAGTGVTHSEYNHSNEAPVKFLQIWFLPDQTDLEPRYEQKAFPTERKEGQFCLLASKDGREGSVTIHQDVLIYDAFLDEGDKATYRPSKERRIWVQVARGQVLMNEHLLSEGDGVGISEPGSLEFSHGNEAQILIFDMKPLPNS